MATLPITDADRGPDGKIRVGPRSLADLLPTPIAPADPAIRRQPLSRLELVTALIIVPLLIASLLYLTTSPTTTVSAPARPLATAIISLSAPLPTAAPTAPPVASAVPEIALVAPIIVPLVQIDRAAPLVIEQTTIRPEDTTDLNDPALNGGNVAPIGCPFPIINGVCGNGVSVRTVQQVVKGDTWRHI